MAITDNAIPLTPVPEVLSRPGAPRLHIRGYRPEIDGLRALAVLPVLLFHAGLGFPGGYVGVDIFFVISGFLITSLIVKEMETGTFSLVQFWARRARRIMPASLLLTLTVLVAGWFLLLPNDFQGLGKSAAAQAVFSSNLYFWSTANYFAADVNTVPLLHTWSLAVEEQFYVFFPLVLLGCYRSAFLRRRNVLIGLFAAALVLSLACSMLTLPKKPIATFYLLPTRAWELLAGSLLAICPENWIPKRRGLREVVSGFGLLTILFVMFRYNKFTPFPGLGALPPCLGTVLIIWSNGSEAGQGSGASGLTLVGRALASRAPVFIGLISYSLYLWHWPLFAFSTYLANAPLSLVYRLAMVALSLVLAILSWRFVEAPFRTRQVFASRRGVLAFAASGLVATLILSAMIVRTHGFAGRFPAQVKDFANAHEDRVPHPEIEAADVLADHLMPLGVNQPDLPPQLLLWGDSHAVAALPALDLYCKSHGLAGRAAVHSGTTPLLDYVDYGNKEEEKTTPYAQAVFDYVQKKRIPRVFIISFWRRDLMAAPDKLERALERTIEAFRATNTTLYIMLQVPSQTANVPNALAFDALYPQRRTEWRTTVPVHQSTQALLYEIATKYRSPKCVFIDPAPAFVDPDGVHYDVVRDGRSLYIDQTHMSVFCSKTLVEPLFEQALGSVEPVR